MSPAPPPGGPGGGPAGTAEVARERHRPRRTCVGCRTTTEAAGLLRLALAPGEGEGEGEAVLPDVRRRLGGRGAWLHADPACLALAVRRRALPRALRVPGPLDVAAVEALLAGTDAPPGGPAEPEPEDG